jgi:hypothetical protein
MIKKDIKKNWINMKKIRIKYFSLEMYLNFIFINIKKIKEIL